MPDVFVAEQETKPKSITPKQGAVVAASPTKSEKEALSVAPINRMPFFAALCKNPDGIQFANQDANEKVVLFLRRHFVTNQRWILITFALLLLPLVIMWLEQNFGVTLGLPQNYALVGVAVYYLLANGFALFNFISWFYNVGIVTTKQVIDVDYENLTNKDVSSATLEAVQDVRYTQGGFLKSFFNYGDVFVQTDTPDSHIQFLSVPKPDFISTTIQKLKEQVLHE